MKEINVQLSYMSLTTIISQTEEKLKWGREIYRTDIKMLLELCNQLPLGYKERLKKDYPLTLMFVEGVTT